MLDGGAWRGRGTEELVRSGSRGPRNSGSSVQVPGSGGPRNSVGQKNATALDEATEERHGAGRGDSRTPRRWTFPLWAEVCFWWVLVLLLNFQCGQRVKKERDEVRWRIGVTRLE